MILRQTLKEGRKNTFQNLCNLVVAKEQDSDDEQKDKV